MKLQQLVPVAALFVMASFGQRVTDRRTADIRGGGGEGKCTIEVVVDDIAEVEILGRNANIRTLSGAPATFRRFQCNQEMPNRPNDFRFKGIDGRGRQDLVRAPGGRGPAVIRIEDSKGGSEGYTFDIFWRGSGGYGGGRNDDRFGDRGDWDRDGWGDGSGWGNRGQFSYSGRGSGEYRDRNGNRGRLYNPRVTIASGGIVTVSFESDKGRLSMSGPVDRRNRNRIFARVQGRDLRGMIEIEMSSNREIRRISMQDEGRFRYELNWSN